MKKTTANNRRKKLPLLLGALLIISVAAYGTRAYFSDSAKQQANIALELGNVDITMDDTEGWKYTPLNANEDTTIDGDNERNKKLGATVNNEGYINETIVTNVRPGDSFTKEFVIRNSGTLDVKLDKVDSSTNPLLENTGTDSLVKVEITDFPVNTVLTPGDINNKKSYTTYKVRITVDPSLDNKYNNNKLDVNSEDTVEFDEASFNALALDYTEKNLSATATQINEK